MHRLQRSHLFAGLLMVGTAGLTFVVATPVTRHRALALIDSSAQELARFGRTEIARWHTPGVAVAARPSLVAPAPLQTADARLVPHAAAEIVPVLGTVDPAGFLALQPSVERSGLTADAALERADLSLPPNHPADVPGPLAAEMASAHQALAFYRKGDIAQGDEFARSVTDPLLRTTLEWVAIRFDPRETGLSRIDAFAQAHAEWAGMSWIDRRREELSLAANHDPAVVQARFAAEPPLTLYGRLALARAKLAAGNALDAAAIVRSVWRTADFDAGEETSILKEFGSLLSRDDHKFRADRLLYKEQAQPALRAAALAGPDVRLDALARIAVINQANPSAIDAAFAAVPKTLAGDPALLFSRIQRARRSNKIAEAADLMSKAPQDATLLVNGDEWWVERRLIARKLLDMGDPRRAYAICASHEGTSDTSAIEAEFHAGWIALRFLNDPKTAATHFARIAAAAATPISKARATYWQGRAAEASGDKEAAEKFYAAAADEPISFYGQLAADRIGRTAIDLRQPSAVPSGDDRREAVRVVEQLYALGERDVALPLALLIAKTETSDSQLAALGAVLTDVDDARATLLVGKIATQRGFDLDETAFPTFGIPGYQPLAHSADKAVVFAIARQKSEFDPKSVSGAGAKGLMQLIASTARQTAQKNGVAFDDTRLLNDAAYNAQIGAAHLGQLLAEQRGSYILTFAAYNAGSGRVKEWIDAYGDPRKPGVDPVDWIERIPFTETRNYVQRVYENLQIYRTRFGQPPLTLAGTQLAQSSKGT